MPVSQFNKFSYQDVGAPVISGSATGSLINVLNYCLVSGSGWLKPFGDTGSVGVFQLPTGSRMTLAVIDNAGGTGFTLEARIQGWETCSAVTAGVPSGSLTAPYGVGCFPSGSQNGAGMFFVNGGGYMPVRVSSAVTSVIRPWYVFADSSSMYCFIATGDTTNAYYGFYFGDVYSFAGGDDAFRCLIIGRSVENTGSAVRELLDYTRDLTFSFQSHWLARSYTGTGVSIQAGKHSDGVRANTNTYLNGLVQAANGTDSALYISPVYVHDTATRTVRGQMRGFYHLLHAITETADGQVFDGINELAGRRFMVLRQTANGGVYVMEISNTVETNS